MSKESTSTPTTKKHDEISPLIVRKGTTFDMYINKVLTEVRIPYKYVYTESPKETRQKIIQDAEEIIRKADWIEHTDDEFHTDVFDSERSINNLIQELKEMLK